MHIVFQTPRLILRCITEEDAQLIYELNSDTEVLKYLHERSLASAEDAKQIIRTIILPQYENNLGRWAVCIKKYQ